MIKTIAVLSSCGIILCLGAIDPGQQPAVQYTAIGLAVLVVGFLCRVVWKLLNDHKEERANLVADLKEITKDHTRAMDRLSDLLEARPCLRKKPE